MEQYPLEEAVDSPATDAPATDAPATDAEDTQPDAEENDSDDIPGWLAVVRAAEDKKATDITVLDLRPVTTFADYFVICTGGNQRQLQAITDEAALQMKRRGEPVISIEGYDGEWILSDYSDILLHCFTDKSREFYSLERLWKEAKKVEIPPAGIVA